MDFFNLQTGKDDSVGSCVHMADGNLWFNISLGQISFHFKSYNSLQNFCSLLESVSLSKGYLQGNEPNFALEEEYEGSRNLCIYSGNLSLTFNLKTEIILGLAKYLREQKEENHYSKG